MCQEKEEEEDSPALKIDRTTRRLQKKKKKHGKLITVTDTRQTTQWTIEQQLEENKNGMKRNCMDISSD